VKYAVKVKGPDGRRGRVAPLAGREVRVEGDLRREVSMNIKRLMDLVATGVSGTARVARCASAHAHQCPTRKGPRKQAVKMNAPPGKV